MITNSIICGINFFILFTNFHQMQTFAVEQRQEADRRAINGLELTGCVLMYNAGKTVFNFIRQHYTNLQKVGILC